MIDEPSISDIIKSDHKLNSRGLIICYFFYLNMLFFRELGIDLISEILIATIEYSCECIYVCFSMLQGI